jgi:hypothetical protein
METVLLIEEVWSCHGEAQDQLVYFLTLRCSLFYHVIIITTANFPPKIQNENTSLEVMKGNNYTNLTFVTATDQNGDNIFLFLNNDVITILVRGCDKCQVSVIISLHNFQWCVLILDLWREVCCCNI